MVVFSLDEVSNSPAVTVFLWLFSALSFSFLFSIWYHYWKRTTLGFITSETHLELYEKPMKKIIIKYIAYLFFVILGAILLLVLSHWLNGLLCGAIYLIDRFALPLFMERFNDFTLSEFFSFYAKDGLKIIVFAFVLLNGVIFPFCVPFYRLKNMYKNLLRMRDEIKSFYEKEEKNLLHKFDKFYSDVMKDMLSNQKK